MEWVTNNIGPNDKISKFLNLEARATGDHLNPITSNSHTSHSSTALLHSQFDYETSPLTASRHFNHLSSSVHVSHIRTNEDDTKYYVSKLIEHGCFTKNQLRISLSLYNNQLFLLSVASINNCFPSFSVSLASYFNL